MKFTKEDAYKELVAKMTSKGEKLNLSERSINEQLDTLITLVATEDTELSDFVDKTLPLFKTADNNVRNDVSVGVKEYKDANPQKTTEPNEKKEPKKEGGEKSELEKRMEALELELANAKREKYETDIRKSIVSKLKDKGVKNEEWVNALLSEINISDKFDVDTKVESYLNLYNKSKADVEYNVSPKGANSTGKPDMISEAIKQAAAFAKSQNLVE